MPVENGLKRYDLTESGKALLEEQKMIRRQVGEKGGFSPAFFDNFFMKIPTEKTAEIYKSMKQLSRAFFHLGSGLQENFSEEALNEALGVLDEASTKFEAIYKKLKGRKND